MIVKITIREDTEPEMSKHLLSLTKLARGEFIRNAIRDRILRLHEPQNLIVQPNQSLEQVTTKYKPVIDHKKENHHSLEHNDENPMNGISNLLKISN